MDDLVAFLQARLDERAARAEAARHGGDGVWSQPYPDTSPGMVADSADEYVVYDDSLTSREQAAHIAANDPARVLREVEAKRRLIELHGADGAHECPEGADAWGARTGYERNCLTLRLLAAVYADHPDYLEEWRP